MPSKLKNSEPHCVFMPKADPSEKKLHKYERKVGQEEKKREFVPEEVLFLSLTGKLRPENKKRNTNFLVFMHLFGEKRTDN